MILTRTYLNARRSGARKLLGSPQAMHAAILAGFPPGVEPGRPLWRLDTDDHLKPTLYVVSHERPDLAHLEEQAGWPSQPTTQSRSYDDFLESLNEGDRWAFRLTANPTHRVQMGSTSKVLAHVTVAQQLTWLLDRASAIGIDLGSVDEPTARVIGREVKKFKRSEQTVTLGTATFDGSLTVSDAPRLRAALTEGIGRAKAYGCGLMTLARPS